MLFLLNQCLKKNLLFLGWGLSLEVAEEGKLRIKEPGFILVLKLPSWDKETTGKWLRLKGCESKSFSIWVMRKESLILSPGLELPLGSCSESLYQEAHSEVSALVNNHWEEEPKVSKLLKCACAPPRIHCFLLQVKIRKAWTGPGQLPSVSTVSCTTADFQTEVGCSKAVGTRDELEH